MRAAWLQDWHFPLPLAISLPLLLPGCETLPPNQLLGCSEERMEQRGCLAIKEIRYWEADSGVSEISANCTTFLYRAASPDGGCFAADAPSLQQWGPLSPVLAQQRPSLPAPRSGDLPR